MRYVDVILPLPLDGTFTYSIPAGMEEKVVPGMRVLVPLGKSKKYIAMVADVHSEKPNFDCKPIDAVLDECPSSAAAIPALAMDQQLLYVFTGRCI